MAQAQKAKARRKGGRLSGWRLQWHRLGTQVEAIGQTQTHPHPRAHEQLGTSFG